MRNGGSSAIGLTAVVVTVLLLPVRKLCLARASEGHHPILSRVLDESTGLVQDRPAPLLEPRRGGESVLVSNEISHRLAPGGCSEENTITRRTLPASCNQSFLPQSCGRRVASRCKVFALSSHPGSPSRTIPPDLPQGARVQVGSGRHWL